MLNPRLGRAGVIGQGRGIALFHLCHEFRIPHLFQTIDLAGGKMIPLILELFGKGLELRAYVKQLFPIISHRAVIAGTVSYIRVKNKSSRILPKNIYLCVKCWKMVIIIIEEERILLNNIDKKYVLEYIDAILEYIVMNLRKYTQAIFFGLLGLSISSAGASTYTLPEGIDRDALMQKTVIVRNGEASGTGIAIGEKHILTAAHNLLGYKLDGLNIQVVAFGKPKATYLIPAQETYLMNDKQCFQPVFQNAPDCRIIKVKQAIFHPQTIFHQSTSEEGGEELNGVDSILEKLSECMHYGLEGDIHYSAKGVKSEYIKVEAGMGVTLFGRVHGPDIALLECEEPHQIPFLEIAEPLSSEKTLLHVLGLSGRRYQNDDSSQIIAAVPGRYKDGIVYGYKPMIYGQRFQCLPTQGEGYHLLLNRVFLKKEGNTKFLLDDQVYPDGPSGFGLIANGDSGAGAVMFKDGTPYLAGIVSAGQVLDIFVAIQNLLEPYNFDVQATNEAGLLKLLKVYVNALLAQDAEKKWFVIQSLADVTHLKPWIKSIINS